MKVEIRDVIKGLQKKNDGSFIFAVAIACLEEADRQSQALKIIQEKKWLVEEILNAFLEDKDKYNLLKEVLK